MSATVGNHVAFNQGEYDPESPEGQHVLAHELAHVRQETGGARLSNHLSRSARENTSKNAPANVQASSWFSETISK